MLAEAQERSACDEVEGPAFACGYGAASWGGLCTARDLRLAVVAAPVG